VRGEPSMGKLVCPYCRTEATDAIGVKRREPRQKHYVFGMAEPYYMHSEGVPYSKKDTFKPKGRGTNPPACSPGLCAWPSRCCYPLTITENSVTRSLANNIRFGLHVIARSKTTKQSIAGSSSTPSNGRSIAAPITPWL